ncbi:hypothetical protein DSM3645_27858 [Blastopirellula marina DSM 3645]|uniref:Major facilitator superfamily (MFS) profile domain-containing protein n=1 Tax=Blastopirellula marina DSM 3645 TaxID=314230 RepID=A3ZX85_9BACT|nr:hypothetical protein DSM3645_27858 [Blastopirellula marina DSM 3645]
MVILAAAAIFLDIGVARLTYGALLPAIVRELELSYTSAGLLNSVNLAAYLVGTLAAPALARRYGYPCMVTFGQAAVAVGAAISGLADGAISLGIGRLMMGGGAGVGLVAVLTLLFARTIPATRPLASTIAWSGFGFAAVLTGLLLPTTMVTPAGWRDLFLSASLIGAVIAIALHREARLFDGNKANASTAAVEQVFPIMSNVRLLPLIGAYTLFGAGYISYSTFVSVQMRADGLSLTAISTAWIILGVSAISGCAFMTFLLVRQSHKHLAMTISLACGAMGTGILAIGGSNLATLAAILVGLGLAATPAVVTAYLRERSSGDDYARVFSLATAWMGLGQLAGPAISGILADNLGTSTVSWFAASTYALGMMAAVWDARAFDDKA